MTWVYRGVVTSHIVRIRTEVRDTDAAVAACKRLGLPKPIRGTAQLFECESLHGAIGAAWTRSRKRIVALKRQRKQARLMAATLNTLHQLKIQEVAG